MDCVIGSSTIRGLNCDMCCRERYGKGEDVQDMYTPVHAGNSTYRGYDGSAASVHLLEST